MIAQGAHITCHSCGAVTPVEEVQEHTSPVQVKLHLWRLFMAMVEFLEKMNSKVLAPELKALEVIPEAVECDILQSKSNEEANAHLLNHLKEDADVVSVRKVFRLASEKTGFGQMNAFAAIMLRGLMEVCIGLCTLTCCCGVPLHVQDMYLCKKMSVYCKQDSVNSLYSLPPLLHAHRAGAA